jgi:hypothetical protein
MLGPFLHIKKYPSEKMTIERNLLKELQNLLEPVKALEFD